MMSGPSRINLSYHEGRDYLGLKLDDLSFTAPIFANLFNDEDGEGHSLIWSRPHRPSERVSIAYVPDGEADEVDPYAEQAEDDEDQGASLEHEAEQPQAA